MEKCRISVSSLIRKFTLPGFVVLGMLLVAACGAGQPEELAVGDEAPGFSLQASNGETVALDDYLGKQPTLLYFHMAMG